MLSLFFGESFLGSGRQEVRCSIEPPVDFQAIGVVTNLSNVAEPRGMLITMITVIHIRTVMKITTRIDATTT